MPLPYELEKKGWTEADFSVMGWHDAPVYGMAFFSDSGALSNELVFDLDYIFQWIDPTPPDRHFSFWIAPSTLIFKNISGLNMQMENEPPMIFDFVILDIRRSDPTHSPTGMPFWKWHLELLNGHISFSASGYEQIIKQQPVLSGSQEFPNRGESNFSRIAF
jgi:hypothetical protein